MKFNLPVIQNEGIAAWLAMVDHIEEVPDNIPALAATSITNGKMVLYLGARWPTWAEDVQREILSHECHHVVFNHHERRCQIDHKHGDDAVQCERDPQLWNMVTDAVLHHNCQGSNWELVEQGVGGNCQVSTFDRLGIPPCRAEIGYDMLLNNKSSKVKVISCGSGLLSKTDGSAKTQELIDKIMIEVGPHIQGASTTGGGVPTPITGTIPDPPKWIRQVIPFLIESINKANRGRSWRRFSRTGSDLLPGREMVAALDGQIFIDQSGSCDEYVALFLAAVCSTPELAGTRVYAFDDQVRGPLPASDAARVRAMLESSRGGTLIKKAGELRESGCPVVWLSDGDSADGLPKPHDAAEIWCIVGNAKTPGRMRIQVND